MVKNSEKGRKMSICYRIEIRIVNRFSILLNHESNLIMNRRIHNR